MRRFLKWTIPALIAIGVVAGIAWPRPEPSVSSYWYEAVDPTSGGGVCAPQWQLLIRTDSPSLYAHTGTSCTAWTKIGSGTAGGGSVTSVSCGTGELCTPNPIVATGSIALNINGGSTQTCLAGQAVTSMTSAGIQSCTAFTPSGSISGTTNHIAAFSSASAVGNALGGATDDGTTYTVPDAVFAATTQAQLGNEALGILSPSSISGTINDWTPTGWTGKTTTIIEAALSNNATINGLAALNTGAMVSICNMSASFILTINDENAGSTAANRFENQGGPIALNPHAGPEPECASYYYSGSLSRWIGRSQTASTIHALTIQSGLAVLSSGSSFGGGASISTNTTASNANRTSAPIAITGTFDTTAGALSSFGLTCSATTTRSAGANNLTNTCGQFAASGGQVNNALVTTTGNNIFNQSSGTSTFDGNLIMGAAGAIIQLIQVSGGAATPKVEAFAGNPNGTVSGTAGDLLLDTSTPAIWQSTGGTGWAQGGGGGSVTGSGTSPDITIWNGTNSVTNFAGATSNACTAGQFGTQLAMSASGALTLTCVSGGGAGTVTGSGTAGSLTEWQTSSAVQNAPITDNGAGTLATTGQFQIGQLSLTGKATDTSTGTVNNFNIATGSSGVSVLRVAPASGVTYTGFECGGATCTSANDGQVLVFYNAGAAAVTLSNDNASSTAGNRIYCQNDTNLALQGAATDPNTAAILVYDGTSTRWRVFATNQVTWNSAIAFGGALTISGGVTFTTNRVVLSTGPARLADTATGPTLTSCGGSPTTTVGEGKFTITVGSTATGCVATFATAFSNTPTCTVTAQNGTPTVYSTSNTAVTLSTGIVSGAKYDVDCTDH